ncbi:MAG: DUF4906 domain-containing protein [Bacteroidales bacterium]|nr:DUF4906 domain-containing protein [Bacteroidales bacterium]
MKRTMKRGLLNIMLTALTAASLAGCVHDNLVQIEAAKEPAFDESDIMDVPLYVNVNGFTTSSSVSTRDEEPAGETETMTEFEKEIDNIWVFQFNSDGNLLIKPRRYTAEKNEADGVWTVVLKPNVESMIHVVANVTNGESWAEDYQYFATVEALLAQTIPSPFPVIFGTEEGFLPMEGALEKVTVESEGTVEVPVESMYAKLKAKVVFDSELLSLYEPAISAVRLSNIPWYCRVGTLYNKEAMSDPAVYPNGSYWISRAIGEGNDPDDDGYDYVFYIPENIQGENENSIADLKTDEMPDNATILTVQIGYLDSDTGASASQSHTVCPGGNNYNNYNIRRNCVYRVALKIGLPNGEEYQPSANCIYAAPGSTVSFEPYYRTETGGGYQFSDYLAPNSEEGTGQQIKGVKILWQTEDCIGDNSDGELVYFEPLKNGTEQTLHSKIYVKVDQPGNAVIAAYDNEDCEGDIIWSWHIWVPNAEVPDPTNEANGKLFTTYYWDSDRIYGYKDADGNVTNYPRTPGYTIMDLNLGALSSEPTADTFPQTYGLLYQFGRKDPFPCARYSLRGEDYNESITGPIYDNALSKVGITAEEVTQGEENEYLFRSISGNTLSANAANYGVDYAIKHPTVFLCGTEEANNVDEIGSSRYYVFNGNWTDEETDNLWGAIPVTEETKTYVISAENNRHLYDDYGEEKSIFDPCPYGWRISPPDLWLSFTDTGLNPQASLDEVNGTYRSGCYGFDLYLQAWRSGVSSFFPEQGPRTPDGALRNSRICGNYSNATADSDNRVNILHIHNAYNNFCIFEMSTLQYYLKSTGGSVRCVRTER